jgi:hypothetical protein
MAAAGLLGMSVPGCRPMGMMRMAIVRVVVVLMRRTAGPVPMAVILAHPNLPLVCRDKSYNL